jgi:hypothetical protein
MTPLSSGNKFKPGTNTNDEYDEYTAGFDKAPPEDTAAPHIRSHEKMELLNYVYSIAKYSRR